MKPTRPTRPAAPSPTSDLYTLRTRPAPAARWTTSSATARGGERTRWLSSADRIWAGVGSRFSLQDVR
jgi:hypothetical protein